MGTEIFWIANSSEKRLAVLSSPSGGDRLEAEMESIRNSGINLLVSLLTVDEELELKLGEESLVCQRVGIEFINFPINDLGVPDLQAGENFIHYLYEKFQRGYCIGIHCRMGVGRSPMLAACLLILSGISSENVWAVISTARKASVPHTIEQKQWVVEFASRNLLSAT